MKFAIAVLCLASVAMGQFIPVPKTGDFRNEFDHLLVESAYHIMQTGEQHLLKLQHDIDTLTAQPTKAHQDQVILEIEESIRYLEGAQGALSRMSARTDLNVVERFSVDEGQALSATLIKDLKEAEVKVKAVKVTA